MASGLNLTYCQWLLYHNLKTVSHYLEQAQFFLYVRLRNLANECDKHFASTTVTSWVMSIVLIWSAIYLLYEKTIGVFLKRMALPLLYRSRLTKSVWNAGFCISCIPLSITKLSVHANRVADIFKVVTGNIFITEQIVPAHVLFSCVVVCAFYIHSICLTYVQKGFDTEFFARGLLLLFLCTCYYLRYIQLALSALVLVNICSLNVEFMRICYSLNRSKVVISGFMWNFTCLLFVIHYILWGSVFLYILPQYYLLPALSVHVSNENLLSFVVLCATLWSHFWLEISSAPAMKLVRYCVWPDSSYSCCDWLDYALFPQHSDLIRHLKHSQCDYFKEKGLQNGIKRNRNSVALYQTVKCVMAIKKRIRRRRAAKALASSASKQLEAMDSSSVQGDI